MMPGFWIFETKCYSWFSWLFIWLFFVSVVSTIDKRALADWSVKRKTYESFRAT